MYKSEPKKMAVAIIALTLVTGIISQSIGAENITFAQEKKINTITVKEEWHILELEDRLKKSEQKMFYELSKKYELDYILTLSVARVESSFKNTVSETDDYGRMQCNINNKKYCEEIAGRKLDFKDDYDSLEAGMIMLRNCFDSWTPKYKDDEKQLLLHAISSYNTGVSATKRISRGGGLSRRTYPSNVLEVYRSFLLGDFSIDPYE